MNDFDLKAATNGHGKMSIDLTPKNGTVQLDIKFSVEYPASESKRVFHDLENSLVFAKEVRKLTNPGEIIKGVSIGSVLAELLIVDDKKAQAILHAIVKAAIESEFNFNNQE